MHFIVYFKSLIFLISNCFFIDNSTNTNFMDFYPQNS